MQLPRPGTLRHQTDVVSSSGSAKKRGRPWGWSTSKKKGTDHTRGGGRRRRKRRAHGVRKSCIMGVSTLTKIRKTDIMSKRKYSIHKAPGDITAAKPPRTWPATPTPPSGPAIKKPTTTYSLRHIHRGQSLRLRGSVPPLAPDGRPRHRLHARIRLKTQGARQFCRAPFRCSFPGDHSAFGASWTPTEKKPAASDGFTTPPNSTFLSAPQRTFRPFASTTAFRFVTVLPE